MSGQNWNLFNQIFVLLVILTTVVMLSQEWGMTDIKLNLAYLFELSKYFIFKEVSLQF